MPSMLSWDGPVYRIGGIQLESALNTATKVFAI